MGFAQRRRVRARRSVLQSTSASSPLGLRSRPSAAEPQRDKASFLPIVHRWTRGPDIAALVWIVHQMLRRSGSIEAFFVDGLDHTAPDLSSAIDSFSTRAMALDLKAIYGRVPKRPGVGYFFPRPSAGSACKRLNLFLRWMAAIPTWLWSKVPASKLTCRSTPT